MKNSRRPACILVLFVLFCLQSYPLLCQQVKCCDDVVCKREAEGFANRFISLTSSSLFDDPPVNGKKLKGQLANIKDESPKVYFGFTREIKAYLRWLKVDEGNRAYCVSKKMLPTYEHNLDWVEETTTLLRDVKVYSPEFCKGFRFHLEAGTGVKDLATSTESFLGSMTGLLSYTFAPKDKNMDVDTTYPHQQCNGRFRLLVGFSESYVDHVGVTQGVVRGEVKLFDIKTAFFSIGNVKGITQANIGINRNYHSIGLGIGADFEIAGFNLIYGIGLDQIHSILQTSLVYHFSKF